MKREQYKNKQKLTIFVEERERKRKINKKIFIDRCGDERWFPRKTIKIKLEIVPAICKHYFCKSER